MQEILNEFINSFSSKFQTSKKNMKTTDSEIDLAKCEYEWFNGHQTNFFLAKLLEALSSTTYTTLLHTHTSLSPTCLCPISK